MGMVKRNAASLRQGFAGLIVVASVTLVLAAATSGGARSQPAKKPLFGGAHVPEAVRAILQRACQDCHSENTTWPWYANIPPISRQIHSDVAKGRALMNLSK